MNIASLLRKLKQSCRCFLSRPAERQATPAQAMQTRIEAHDREAEEVINQRGDIDAALHIYRRKQDLQREFAEAFGLAEMPVRYMPADWVRNIGHMALLDFWVKMKHLGWYPWEHLVLLAPPHATANETYLSYWKRHFTVISGPHLVRGLAPFAAALGSRVAGLLKLPDGREEYFGEGIGIIQEEWERQGRKPLLELTAEDAERGQETLLQMGVPRGAWFVSLHVRSPGFHRETGSDQAHRNADVGSYLPAIRRTIERGGFVIRLGDRTMDQLPALPGLIDYAHSPFKSPSMDVFLCAACRFFVGVASGLAHVPSTFGVPCALTNWVSNPFPVYGLRDRFIPKLIWSGREKRLLDFEESLEPGVRRLGYCGSRLAESGLRAVDNTPEEILELVEEMLDVLDGTVAYSVDDGRLQDAFRGIAGGRGMVGFSRIGRGFLRRYAHLLGDCHRGMALAG